MLRKRATFTLMSSPAAAVELDPVWEAFERAPEREETPEEREAFEAAQAAGGFIDGAEVCAMIARRRDGWPGDAGK